MNPRDWLVCVYQIAPVSIPINHLLLCQIANMQLHWKSWSAVDKSDDKKDDKDAHQNGSTIEQPNQKNNMEDELVPVVIKPGHIRFEPLEEGSINCLLVVLDAYFFSFLFFCACNCTCMWL